MNLRLPQLTHWLRARRHQIVTTQKIHYGEYDQTYGTPTIGEIEAIDFDALLAAIDEFSQEFKQ